METRKLGFYKHQDLSSQKIMSETEIGGLNTILGGKIQQTEITGKHMSPAFKLGKTFTKGLHLLFFRVPRVGRAPWAYTPTRSLSNVGNMASCDLGFEMMYFSNKFK